MQTAPTKIGRNAPCWCGSGKKYKKCHLGRERQAPLGVQNILDQQRRAFTHRACLHPLAPADCKGKIVEAHTIQRGGGLSRIARAGHVYGFVASYAQVGEQGLVMAPRLIGVRDASTFTGFCGHHDQLLFRPIETQPIVPTPEQAFLLGYRGFCHEFFMKERVPAIVPLMREMDRGKDAHAQSVIQSLAADFQHVNSVARRDGRTYKDLCDRVLLKRTFEHVTFLAFAFDRPPSVVCSSLYAPEFDFHGRRIQDLSAFERVAGLVAVTLTATAEGGIGLLSWVGEHPASTAFAASLAALPDADVPDALIRMVFESFENTFVGPAWWDALDDRVRKALLERMNEGGLSEEPRPRALMDDGIRAATWLVTGRTSVGLPSREPAPL
jgi:hypothetical protein